MAKPTDFAYHLTTYFTSYLSGRKNFSINTIHSYRDAFKLLFLYCDEKLHVPSGKIQFKLLTAEKINDYADWLRDVRKNSPATINQRLAAIHAFFKYLQGREPSHLLQCQQILAVKFARTPRPMIEFMSIEALQLILNGGDGTTKRGRRDLLLLHLLYDSGARVQELCDLRLRDIFLNGNPHVILTGKGNKTRYVPIVTSVAQRISAYLAENQMDLLEQCDMPLFFNQQNRKLTRTGVSHIVGKYADVARTKSPLIPHKVTPHIFRHSKAMHLCQAGIDIVYIRDILGHVDLATTEIYARLNIELMRDALENAYPELPSHNLPEWTTDNELMNMLNSL